jgi:hypothetical protein
MSRAAMAGFQLTLYGRIWVTPEARKFRVIENHSRLEDVSTEIAYREHKASKVANVCNAIERGGSRDYCRYFSLETVLRLPFIR